LLSKVRVVLAFQTIQTHPCCSVPSQELQQGHEHWRMRSAPSPESCWLCVFILPIVQWQLPLVKNHVCDEARLA
jgi:hypothetical protein